MNCSYQKQRDYLPNGIIHSLLQQTAEIERQEGEAIYPSKDPSESISRLNNPKQAQPRQNPTEKHQKGTMILTK